MELQVMILDDEYIILDGLCSFPWSDYGYRISATARNGLEGLEKLEQAKPDLILTAVSYTHLRAHETKANLVCRLLLEKKKKKKEEKGFLTEKSKTKQTNSKKLRHKRSEAK